MLQPPPVKTFVLTRGAEDLAEEVPERAVAVWDLTIETAVVVFFFPIWGFGSGLARLFLACLESQEVTLSFLSMVISRSEVTASVEEGISTGLETSIIHILAFSVEGIN